jgi:5-methylcytosine-specific restriction endonuclease McrA
MRAWREKNPDRMAVYRAKQREAYVPHPRDPVEVECVDCGETITWSGSGARRRRCVECKKEYERARDNARNAARQRERRLIDPEYAEKERARCRDRADARYRRKRDRVVETWGSDCYLCGEPCESDLHIDHVIPHSKGGSSRVVNLRMTHSRCNMSKGDAFVSFTIDTREPVFTR